MSMYLSLAPVLENTRLENELARTPQLEHAEPVRRLRRSTAWVLRRWARLLDAAASGLDAPRRRTLAAA